MAAWDWDTNNPQGLSPYEITFKRSGGFVKRDMYGKQLLTIGWSFSACVFS